MGCQNNNIVDEKGIVCLTQFGFDFIKVCVLEKDVIFGNDLIADHCIS